jgi:D-alanyl-lipoteichoic acid acyltransferase DltB (MBOAT superfamily)
MFGAALVDYVVAQRIFESTDERKRRLLLVFSISFSLGLMCIFKYTGWISESLVRLGTVLGISLIAAPIALPLPPGVSFYTFETISYTVDVYRREFEPRRRLFDYLSFIVFFPHLVAGPIRRAKDLLPVLASYRPPLTWDAAGQALFYILWGVLLKVTFADNFGAIVEAIDAQVRKAGTLPAGTGLIFAYAFGFQIYCDFAAYSLIARGSALLFGVDVQRNFLTPYFATNPSDFWHRWHISLSTWMRDYLYIPLGGNEHGKLITLRNLLIVMILGGLWHGAGVFFILWGLWHGLLLVVYRLVPVDDFLARFGGPFGRALAMILLFHLVGFGWILFRSNPDTFPAIMRSIAAMPMASLDPTSGQWLFGFAGPAGPAGWFFLVFAAPVVLTDFIGYLRNCEFPDLWNRLPVAAQALLVAAVFYGIIFFAARRGIEFIYFQF